MYHSFTAKAKYIKRIIDKSKKADYEEVSLKYSDAKLEDVPEWEIEDVHHFSSHGKYIMFSSNSAGYMDLAFCAGYLSDFEDEESYMCDYHVHLGHYKYQDRVATDFWYYYESH